MIGAATTYIFAGAAGVALLPLLIAAVSQVARWSAGVTFLGRISRVIDSLVRLAGNGVMWLSLSMVLVQVAVVGLRYVFGEGRVYLQESMLYMNGILFLAAAGYTLLQDGHVRVDIFYRGATPRSKAIIDLVGAYLFLFPVTIVLFAVSLPYVRQSWLFAETSRETGGIPFVYGLKAFILVFCLLLFLEGLSTTIHNLLRLVGAEPYSRLETQPLR